MHQSFSPGIKTQSKYNSARKSAQINGSQAVTDQGQTSVTVFLSYSRANRDAAVQLYSELIQENINLWRDVHDIAAGAPDWWAEIRRAIDSCESMILCLSLEALRSTV